MNARSLKEFTIGPNFLLFGLILEKICYDLFWFLPNVPPFCSREIVVGSLAGRLTVGHIIAPFCYLLSTQLLDLKPGLVMDVHSGIRFELGEVDGE